MNLRKPFLDALGARLDLGAHRHEYRRHRLFIVEHLYEDTCELLKFLHHQMDIPIDVLVAIPYSSGSHGRLAPLLHEAGIRVQRPRAEEMDLVLREELRRSLDRCEQDGRQLLIHEVGGYVTPLLHREFPERLHLVRGSAEITKQGKWRVQQMEQAGTGLGYPFLHCTESELKRVESTLFVGDAVVAALDRLLRRGGYALAGREAAVLGFGWIGRGLCEALRRKGTLVSTFDPDPVKQVEAHLMGYRIGPPEELVSRCAILIGASGVRSITAEMIGRLRDRTVLCSASSRDIEIDVAALRRQAVAEVPLGSAVHEYHLADGRRLYLLHGGYPLNFLEDSVPDEIVEMILGEILVLLHALATREHRPGIHLIEHSLDQVVADVWLQTRFW